MVYIPRHDMEPDVRVGVKILLNEQNVGAIERFVEVGAFLEIGLLDQPLVKNLAMVNQIKKYLKSIDREDMPIVVHAPHLTSNFNPCEPGLHGHCARLLDNAMKVADAVQSPIVVVHPGAVYLDENIAHWSRVNKEMPLEEVQAFNQKLIRDEFIQDLVQVGRWNQNVFLEQYFGEKPDALRKRIHWENCLLMTYDWGAIGLDSTPWEMNDTCRTHGFSMTLDLAHAGVTANALGEDVNAYIQKFLDIKPGGEGVYFHLAGFRDDDIIDEHLSLNEAKNQKFEFLAMIKDQWTSLKPLMVTLETFKYKTPEIGFAQLGRDHQLALQYAYDREFTNVEVRQKIMKKFLDRSRDAITDGHLLPS